MLISPGSVSDNFGSRIDYDYDSMGNQTVEDSFDPGNVLKRALVNVYDLNYRLDMVTRGGFVADLTFDAVANFTAEMDPKLANTQHNYDALTRVGCDLEFKPLLLMDTDRGSIFPSDNRSDERS